MEAETGEGKGDDFGQADSSAGQWTAWMLCEWVLGTGYPQMAAADTHENNMKDRRFSVETRIIKVSN